MSNTKKLDYYDVITGNSVDEDDYGFKATVNKKVDNVDQVFDSRGSYLGIRTFRGRIINGKFTCKKGGRFDFKSCIELEIWKGKGSSCYSVEKNEGKGKIDFVPCISCKE